jgi:hypothetical protein
MFALDQQGNLVHVTSDQLEAYLRKQTAETKGEEADEVEGVDIQTLQTRDT